MWVPIPQKPKNLEGGILAKSPAMMESSLRVGGGTLLDEVMVTAVG